MNRRQKIIVSVTGIFIVLLILIGLTYAYFLTRITGNSNPTSISVTTANLELVYGDGTTALLTSSTPIEPGKFSSSKDFTVTNNGNTLTDYAVTLEDFAVIYANDTVIDGESVKAGTVTKMEYPSDMKMEITCVIESDNETRNGKACGNIDSTLPTENSILLTNSIEVDDIHKYVLTLIYVDSGIDQSLDMNKTIKGKIDIIDPKSTIDLTGSVASYQTGDYVEINSTPIKSEIIDGKYTLIGVEPGNHTLYVKYKDANGDVQTRGSETLTIKKGKESNVSGTTITFTEDYRIAIVDLESDYTVTVDETLKKLNYTLSEKILLSAQEAKVNNDSTRTLYNDTYNLNSITGISAETDRMLALAEDDYGTSYVFRGAVKDNYVNFAGFIWRVVRINGDGSVRLILDGSLDKVEKDGVAVYTNSNLQAIDSDGIVAFKSSPYNDNAYVGYMYGEFDTNSTSYNEAHQNKNNSTIKTYVDEFYKEYLLSYQDDYIADSLFCGDKTLASASIGSSNQATGFGTGSTNSTYYAATERLYYSTGTTSITTAKPTLECASSKNATDTLTEEQRAYSRYTSNIDSNTTTSKGVLVNNDLTYPIGLLSADELVMTGAFRSKTNASYYLYDAYEYETPMLYNNWWTMSPNYFTGSYAYEFYSSTTSYSLGNGLVHNAFGVRPVINLKAGILLNDGEGTYDSPYTVKVG